MRSNGIAKTRGLAFAALATVAIVALAGCSADGGGNADLDADQTISVWGWSGAPGASTMGAIIDAYEEQNPNITVEFNEIANTDYANRATLALSSGQPIDVIGVFPNNWATENQDFLTPVSDWPNSDDLLDELSAAAVSQVEVLYTDGVARSVPMYSGGDVVGFYNAELLNQAGFSEPPATWDEMQELAGALSSSAPGVLPAIIPNDTWMQADFILTLAGHNDSNFWNSVRYDEGRWDTPAVVDAFATYGSLYERGILDESTLDIPYSDAMATFNRGDAAIVFTGSWEAGLLRDAYREENDIDVASVGVMPVPATDPESRGMRAFVDATFGIPANSDHKEAAADFIRFMTVGEGVDVWASTLIGVPAVDGWMLPDDVLSTDIAADGYRTLQELIANPNSDRNVLSNFENQQGTYALEVARGSLSPEEAASRGQADLESGRYN